MHRHPLADGAFEEKNVLENVLEFTDVVQIGARNMKSYGFLQELAIKTSGDKRPILLKRGESSTLRDFLLAAEYIVSCGNPNVMLCLRGIRTFEEESFQRYTPDVGAITVLKKETNLPVLFDPSHASGYRNNVYSLSMAAIAAGADGCSSKLITIHRMLSVTASSRWMLPSSRALKRRRTHCRTV